MSVDLKDIAIQLERLKRHFSTSVNHNDEVSLLDLSNVLRIWTEYKNNLEGSQFPLITKPFFKTAAPNKNIKKKLNNYNYFCFYLPDGIFTKANNGHIIDSPINGPISVFSSFKPDNQNKLWISYFLAVEQKIDDEILDYKEAMKSNVIKVNFNFWLSSEIVRLYDSSKKEIITISREMLIKRIANILAGSHAKKEQSSEFHNKFDKHIEKLMDYKCGGLPIPYFILLKIASDILNNMPKILGLKLND